MLCYAIHQGMHTFNACINIVLKFLIDKQFQLTSFNWFLVGYFRWLKQNDDQNSYDLHWNSNWCFSRCVSGQFIQHRFSQWSVVTRIKIGLWSRGQTQINHHEEWNWRNIDKFHSQVDWWISLIHEKHVFSSTKVKIVFVKNLLSIECFLSLLIVSLFILISVFVFVSFF